MDQPLNLRSGAVSAGPPAAEAALIERDKRLWRLTVWYATEAEARMALTKLAAVRAESRE